MIVKYKTGSAWGYIDNVRQAANVDFSTEDYIKQYNEEVEAGARQDVASYIDFSDGKVDPEGKIPADIAMTNKAFLVATENIKERMDGKNYHSENLLDTELIANDVPAAVVLLHIEDCKDYDAVVLVTNQTVYLMNDKGQTIERLV
jgi:hypothetical protein